MLWGLEEGVWLSVWARLGKSIPSEAHSGDSAEHPYVPIWPRLIPAANQAVFSQTRGHLAVPLASAATARMLINDKSDEIQLARMHMLEIANSARQPWTAYGDGHAVPSISLLARHFRWGPIFGMQAGNVSRTEMGSGAPGGDAAGNIRNAQPNI
jgi:hypothetical protein